MEFSLLVMAFKTQTTSFGGFCQFSRQIGEGRMRGVFKASKAVAFLKKSAKKLLLLGPRELETPEQTRRGCLLS